MALSVKARCVSRTALKIENAKLKTHFAIGMVLIVLLFSCNGGASNQGYSENEVVVDSATTSNITPRINPKLASGEYSFYMSGIDTVYNWNVPDSIPRIEMDEMLIQDSWFIKKKRQDSSSGGFFTTYGNLVAVDNVWFQASNGNQFMVFSLYTDYHRVNQILGYTDMINDNILDAIEVYWKPQNIKDYDSLATRDTKRNSFNSLLSKGFKVSLSLCRTRQGIVLGMNTKNVFRIYGEPDSTFYSNKETKCFWGFESDIFQQKPYHTKKPLATNSYGYEIEAFFRKNKLTGLILWHMIP